MRSDPAAAKKPSLQQTQVDEVHDAVAVHVLRQRAV